MAVDRDEFFAELDGLTEKEIEARLAVWDREQLVLVQEYLDRKGWERAKATRAPQVEIAPSTKDAARASVEEVAKGANTRATVALIFSIGAMLAAIASAFVAFVALQH